MTKSELLKALDKYDNEDIVVCMDESGGWDNIQEVKGTQGVVAIVFGGGSPFSDD